MSTSHLADYAPSMREDCDSYHWYGFEGSEVANVGETCVMWFECEVSHVRNGLTYASRCEVSVFECPSCGWTGYAATMCVESSTVKKFDEC